MLCNEFSCRMLDGSKCKRYGNACNPEVCGYWGECIECQQINTDPCAGLPEMKERRERKDDRSYC